MIIISHCVKEETEAPREIKQFVKNYRFSVDSRKIQNRDQCLGEREQQKTELT